MLQTATILSTHLVVLHIWNRKHELVRVDLHADHSALNNDSRCPYACGLSIYTRDKPRSMSPAQVTARIFCPSARGLVDCWNGRKAQTPLVPPCIILVDGF